MTKAEAKALKRKCRAEQRAAMSAEMREGRAYFRCYWTWPFGHVSSGMDAGYHSECLICNKTLTSAD